MRQFLAVITSWLNIVACSSTPELIVTKAEAGEDWPYPNASRAIKTCQNRNQVIIKIDGKEYGLNGKAQGAGYPPSQDQMKADSDGIVTNTGPPDWVKKIGPLYRLIGFCFCRYSRSKPQKI